MENSALGLAFLQTSFSGQTDPIGALSPILQRSFVKNRNNKDVLGVDELRDLTAKTFGLEIPLHVIRYIMSAFKRDKIVTEIIDPINRAAEPRYKALEIDRAAVLKIEETSRQKYNLVVEEIKRTLLNIESNKDPDEFLADWLDHSALSIFGSEKSATDSVAFDVEINRVMTLCFERQTGPEFIEHLTEIAIGNSLYRGIKAVTEYDFESDEAASTSMSELAVFLDTPIVLSLLGIHDHYHENAANELLGMCKSTGSTVSVFDHTVKEIQTILAAGAANFYHPNLDQSKSVKQWAIREGFEPADIVTFAANVATNLETLGIGVIERPSATSDYQLSIAEGDLRTVMENKMERQSDAAREHDRDALTAIFRLRGGKPFRVLSKSKAIFVTSNRGLQSVSAQFFKAVFLEEGHSASDSSVQLCMTDVVFSMRLWTRLPTSTRTLPKSQIIAHTISSIAPSKEIRAKFLQYLEKLSAKGIISDAEKSAIELSNLAELTLATSFPVYETDMTDQQAERIWREIRSVDSGLFDLGRIGDLKAKELSIAKLTGRVAELQTQLEIARKEGTPPPDVLESEVAKVGSELESTKKQVDRHQIEQAVLLRVFRKLGLGLLAVLCVGAAVLAVVWVESLPGKIIAVCATVLTLAGGSLKGAPDWLAKKLLKLYER